MKSVLSLFILIFSFCVNAQNSTKSLVNFNPDYNSKQFVVKINNFDSNITNLEVEVKCFTKIKDYKNQIHSIEILNIKQKIVNNHNLFFGGDLVKGEYVITTSYIENGVKIKKIEKKLI